VALYVNGEKLDEQEILDEIERLRSQYERVFADQTSDEQQTQLYEWSRENVIERVLMRQAAFRDEEILSPEIVETAYRELMDRHGGERQFYERAGLSKDQQLEVKKDIDRQIRMERLLERITSNAPEPSPQDVRAFYEENIERFTAPEMVRAAHIVKHCQPCQEADELRAELEQVLERLRAGEDFEKLAAEHSDCPDQGGDLGFFPRGHMVDEFDDVVFAMDIDEISDVFRTQFGYHIVKMAGRKPASPYPLEQVRETIVQELGELLQQKALEDFVDKEKAKATLEEK